jgi:hypothetical protein
MSVKMLAATEMGSMSVPILELQDVRVENVGAEWVNLKLQPSQPVKL